MNILFIGDIVGKPGRETVKELIPDLKKEFELDSIIANVENAAGGSGITSAIANELFSFGIDVFTSGDHIFKRKEVAAIINEEPRLLRPANFPLSAPGRGAHRQEQPIRPPRCCSSKHCAHLQPRQHRYARFSKSAGREALLRARLLLRKFPRRIRREKLQPP